MTITRAPWLADVLRAAGLTVVEHAGWQGRGHGDFTDLTAVVWHHDASPPGDSPGVPEYMLGQWDTAAAQLWVNRQGVWHILAAGVAWHAGRVLPGMPGNRASLGVETDHTTGEDWPQALLDSLRLGTAAILTRLGRDAGGLHFHKSICDPVGRKSDPAGLDLTGERARVRRLQTAPSPTTSEDLTIMDAATQKYLDDNFARIGGGPRVRDAAGKVIDKDGFVSIADAYTLVEESERRTGERIVASEARILAAIQAKP